MNTLLFFLEQLAAQKIAYTLHSVREAIMVSVAVPGERWEIEFFADGSVEIERFISTGKIEDEGMLNELFARFANEHP